MFNFVCKFQTFYKKSRNSDNFERKKTNMNLFKENLCGIFPHMESKIRYGELNLFTADGINNAVLRANIEDSTYSYSFTIQTESLYRMKSESDNKAELLIDGAWYYFTASCLSNYPNCDVECTILENNNRKSRYRLNFKLDKMAQDAKAEGLALL